VKGKGDSSRIPPYKLNRYNSAAWLSVPGTQLKPSNGDRIVSIMSGIRRCSFNWPVASRHNSAQGLDSTGLLVKVYTVATLHTCRRSKARSTATFMSNAGGSKNVWPNNSAWNETQPQVNGRTVEIIPPPAPLRDPSISGSERLRRTRFEQAAFDFSSDQGSSGGRFTHAPTTTYAGSIATDEMSQLHGGDNNQAADNVSIVSYNSARDVSQFIREINGREKQSVALVLAMGGLYLCPEVTEAILNPADGQPKRILDLVDLAPPPVDTGAFPPNLRFEIDDINLGLAHFYDQFDLVHARCVSGGINDMDKTIVEFQRCLKPGGFLIIMEGDHMYETRHKLARLKRMRGDPDVSAVSENGSYLRRMIVEVCEAGTLAGSCINRA
ncbi:10657_t:CDS:2, partial [Acaulospora colombiana]